MANCEGVDVSYHNDLATQLMNWEYMRAHTPVRFSTIKASGADGAPHGSLYHDVRFTEHWRDARAAGYKVGAYHYYYPTIDPLSQARWFYNTVSATGFLGDYEPALDVEYDPVIEGNGPISAAGIHACLVEMERLFGRINDHAPAVYTSVNYWSKVSGDKSWASAYPLWVANWGVLQPRIPWPWTNWVFWQYTISNEGQELYGTVSHEIDLDVFNGDDNAFYAYCYSTPPPPAIPIPLGRVRVVAANLHVRASPDVTGLDRGYVKSPVEFYFFEMVSGWAKIGASAWISTGPNFAVITERY